MIPVAGTRLRVLPLPPSVQSWKRAGSQFSGSRQTPGATLDNALFNKAEIVDGFSRDMESQLWEQAAGHWLGAGMEGDIITDIAEEARNELIREKNFMAVRALDFLVCGAIDEPHLPADGSIPTSFFSVRCGQRTLATRKHELWECLGNNWINTHMQICDHLVASAEEVWDTDRVLFARGLLPRDC